MGVVSVALDTELDRSIALKEIREVAADNSTYRARFLAEAEITGKLEHPSIIPIYGLGTYPDGRPFYAMRLIRGDKTGSLTDAIKSFYQEPDPAGRVVEFRGLLRRFLDVCNAIEYAHSKNVLHRDLKPDNILLGPYGETLVVDWGLAKAAGKADPVTPDGGDHVRLTLSGGELSPTLDGSAFGTPEYAPPEQMTGDLENVSPRSDVYGLGAILYGLMTGQPPFSRKGIGLGELIEKVEAGDFPPPRQVRSEADKVLEAICLKAMSRRPADRYESARALAADLERYLADEPVTAYREPWMMRARRWRRKNRTAVASAAAALVVIIATLTVGLVVVGKLNRTLDRSNTKLAAALASETKALNLAVERKKLADENFMFALDAVKAQVFDINEQLRNRPGTRNLREKLQKNASDRLKTLVERTSQRALVDLTAITAHNNLGDIYLRVDLKPTLAREQYQKAYEMAKAFSEANPDDFQARRELTISYERLGNVSLQTGQTAKALEYYQKSLEMREELARSRPSDSRDQRDFQVSYNKIGDVLFQTGQTARALDYYQKGLGVSEALARSDPNDSETRRNLLVSYDRLGDALFQTGQTARALDYYQKSADVAEALARSDPNNSQTQGDLSISYGKLGDVSLKTGATARALEYYKKGLNVREALARSDPDDSQAQRDLSVLYSKLGDVSLMTGGTVKALEYYHKSLGVRETLAKSDPRDTQAQRDLSISYERLGNASLQASETAKALDYYQKGLGVSEALARSDPDDSQARRDLSVYYNKLGDLAEWAGETAKALDYYQKDLGLSQVLAESDPNDSQARRDLSISYDRLGNVSLKIGETAKALDYYQKALGVRETLAGSDPKNVQAQRDLSVSYSKVGDVFAQTGETAKALESFQKGQRVCEALARSDPDDSQARRGLAISYGNLGDLALKTGEVAKALEYYTLALELSARLSQADPTNGGARRDLEICTLNQRLSLILQGAEQPRDNAERLNLARWAYLKRLPSTSARLYAEAMEADPKVGDERKGQPRYLAASAASMAGSGQGFDVPRPDDDAKAKRRDQALGWLKAELTFWERYAATIRSEERGVLVRILDGWKKNADLAGVRDTSSLEKLPESERKKWLAFWAEVDSLRAKLEAK